MKVMLVDDERIALERVGNLLEWSRHGYEIAATATNGKSALRLCEEIRPQIVIADIRMPVMDGLDLIRAASERKLGVKFIIMSAYEDFDCARQAIALGNVSGYLIKHEMDRDHLLQALQKAKDAWQADEKQRRIERARQLKQALADSEALALAEGEGEFHPPFAVALMQEDLPFAPVPPAGGGTANGPAFSWPEEDLLPLADHPEWTPVGEFALDRARFIAVYARKAKTAAPRRESFRELAAKLQARLRCRFGRPFSLFYSFHDDGLSTLSRSLHRVETAARHAVFCGKDALLCADDLPLNDADGSSLPLRGARLAELARLAETIRQLDAGQIESAINRLFDSSVRPYWDLPLLHETIRTATAAASELLAAKGLPAEDPLDPRRGGSAYHIDEIRSRLTDWIIGVCSAASPYRNLSGKLLKAVRYIGDHYHEDINIEDVAYSLGISASYLHQLFKREMDRTFHDYLTEIRIEQAKRILSREDAKMTDVCARVGYRSPQHFSQVFKKVTGLLPHQYRHGVRA
jgi:two-component system response regulator YesN